jgi:hypothetical protein
VKNCDFSRAKQEQKFFFLIKLKQLTEIKKLGTIVGDGRGGKYIYPKINSFWHLFLESF